MFRSVIVRVMLLAVVISCLFSMGCKKKTAPQQPPLAEVTVAKPIVKDVVFHAYYTGRLQAVASVDLRARVKGFLKSNNFTDGDFVKKDQLLFEIDPAQFEADVLDAKGKLGRMLAVEKDAKFNYRRTKEAHAKNVATDNELMNALAKKDSAIADVESARAALEQAKINLGYTKVRSPIDGQISRHYVDPGNLVGASSNTLLGTVIKNDPIYVYFDVSGNDILAYQKKSAEYEQRRKRHQKNHTTSVRIRLSDSDDYDYEGKIDYANIQINPNTQTLQLRGILPNDSHVLIPGMFAEVQVPIRDIKNALLVPSSAIGSGQGGDYVLVLDNDNVVSQKFIKTGQKHGLYQVVVDGIKEDARIITEGIQSVRVGYPVKPKEITLKYQDMPKGVFIPGNAKIQYLNGEDKAKSTTKPATTQPSPEKKSSATDKAEK